MRGKIRVYCRIRPLNAREMMKMERNVVGVRDECTVQLPWKDKNAKYMYHHVFDENATQEDIFEDTKVS